MQSGVAGVGARAAGVRGDCACAVGVQGLVSTEWACRNGCTHSRGTGEGARAAGVQGAGTRSPGVRGGVPTQWGCREQVHAHRSAGGCPCSGGAGVCMLTGGTGSGCARRWPPARLEGGGEPGTDYTSFSLATVVFRAYLPGPSESILRKGRGTLKGFPGPVSVFHLWVQFPSLKFRDSWKNSALKH